jgi:hypothetical protein
MIDKTVNIGWSIIAIVFALFIFDLVGAVMIEWDEIK